MRFLNLFLVLLQCFAQTANTEEYKFESEVNQVMDIIIHSLYKTKDVFLRELISNGADALDKIRLASLQDNNALGEIKDLKIQVSVNGTKLVIRDTGIGMTKAQLKLNLGTIAKSGTKEFLEALKNQDLTDPGLIGKFGVGFYSAFLVADTIKVVSKNNDDDQYIWESSSQSNYKISKDPRGNTLGRGTEIILELKEDAAEFLKSDRLKDIIKKHSEFVNFPIYLLTESQVPVEKEDIHQEPEDEDGSVEDVKEETNEPEFVTVSDWELMNDNKPIWLKDPVSLKKSDYNAFFRQHFGDLKDPIAYKHFKIEGDAEFNCLIYVPATAPRGFMRPEVEQHNFVQLFVKRVLITEDLVNFLPKWLSFLKVVIDSDDLPLNVSRETLQNHHSLKNIKNKIISKALDLLTEIAEGENGTVYKTLYNEFSSGIKYGLYDAKSSHLKKLTELVRFPSSTDKFTSFSDYHSRMKKNQPQIYISTVESSPFVDDIIESGHEVLFLLEPVEEFIAREILKKYKDVPLQDVNKQGLLYGNEDESKDSEIELAKKFKPLTDYLLQKLSSQVSDVRISTKMKSAVAAVLPSEMGISPSQEKMMLLQNTNPDDPAFKFYMSQKRIFQINPSHILILKLLEIVESGDTNKIKYVPKVLYDTYAIGSGWEVRKPKVFASRVEKLLRQIVGVEQAKKDEDEKADSAKNIDFGHDEL